MKLVILDPGHFHAALVQKTMIAGIDATVRVYAPDGPDLADYLRKVESYNARATDPTCWNMQVCAGPDFLDRFAHEKAGDLAVISGNNRRKTEYIARAVDAGYHVLADKPMAIDADGFAALELAFAAAERKGVLLYDIMTERHEITTLLQKEFSRIPALFGELCRGTADGPAVTKESVHHFAKLVSGTPVRRPTWFFDVDQQGEGLVDITTHLVDLVQWECFPDAILDGRKDVRIHRARRWPTALTQRQFAQVTQTPAYPSFLQKDVQGDGSLHVYANGAIDYCIKDIHARVSVIWNFEAPDGGADTHQSVMRGTRSTLAIRQGAAQGWAPVLTIEPSGDAGDQAALQPALDDALAKMQDRYPGVDAKRVGDVWQVLVPAVFHVGHEAHFGQVMEAFLAYVARGYLPEWEVPDMLAKYWTTTQALAIARQTLPRDRR